MAVLLALRAGRERQLESRRTEAQELRETAQTHDQQAELEQAEADRQAARARKAQAEAEEQAAIARTEAVAAQERSQAAEREGSLAREHHERARAIDPDVPDTHDEDGWDESRDQTRFDAADPRGEADADYDQPGSRRDAGYTTTPMRAGPPTSTRRRRPIATPATCATRPRPPVGGRRRRLGYGLGDLHGPFVRVA